MMLFAQVWATSVGSAVVSQPGLGERMRASCDWSMMSCRCESRVRKKLALMKNSPDATGLASVLVQRLLGHDWLRRKSPEHLPGVGAGASPSLARLGSGTQVPPLHSASSEQKERSPNLLASMAATTKPCCTS